MQKSKTTSSMACLVAVASFSVPFSFSLRTLFFKEMIQCNFFLDRPFKQLSYATDTELSAFCSIADAIPPRNQIYGYRCLDLQRYQSEVVFCPTMGVDSCTHMIISGYWVGPDVEDGWGFVEAFVNRIG